MPTEKSGPPGRNPAQTSEPPSELQTDSPSEAILKPALRLLTARARSVKELRERLLKKGFTTSDTSNCIRWLVNRDLLNDESFARSFTRDRLRFSPRSPFLLKREATTKGVATALAGDVVESVLQEEGVSADDLSARAAESWIRKQSTSTRKELLGDRFKPETEKARRRLHGFLARRGFAGDAAHRGLEAGRKKAEELEEETGP